MSRAICLQILGHERSFKLQTESCCTRYWSWWRILNQCQWLVRELPIENAFIGLSRALCEPFDSNKYPEICYATLNEAWLIIKLWLAVVVTELERFLWRSSWVNTFEFLLSGSVHKFCNLEKSERSSLHSWSSLLPEIWNSISWNFFQYLPCEKPPFGLSQLEPKRKGSRPLNQTTD